MWQSQQNVCSQWRLKSGYVSTQMKFYGELKKIKLNSSQNTHWLVVAKPQLAVVISRYWTLFFKGKLSPNAFLFCQSFMK